MARFLPMIIFITTIHAYIYNGPLRSMPSGTFNAKPELIKRHHESLRYGEPVSLRLILIAFFLL